MRNFVFAIALLLGISPAAIAQTINYFFGDSETAGGFVTSGLPRLYYPWMFSYLRGEDLVNYAVGGRQAAHSSVDIFGNTPVSGHRYFYMIGTNDLISKGNGAPELATFKQIVTAQTYWMASTHATGQGGSWTYTGSWTNNGLLGVGKYTGTPGDTASITFSGDTLIFGYIIGDSPYGGTFKVEIDSVNKGTFPVTAGSTIYAGGATQNWGPASLRFTGLGAGSHTLVITAIAADLVTPHLVFVEWIATGVGPSDVYLLAQPNLDPVIRPGSYLGVTDYNTILSDIATQAAGDGYSVTYIDTSILGSDMGPDGAHPTNQGSAKITNILLNAVP